LIEHNNKKIILDPETTRTPLGIPSIVTHAHGDHTASLMSRNDSFLTQITLDLHNATNGRVAKSIFIKEDNETFELNGFEIEFIPAGHLLGAVQVIVRADNKAIHYTGDFCPESLLTTSKAKVPQNIDLSIIDTTYGNDKIIFDPRTNSRRNLFLWTVKQLSEDKIPVMNVAKLGGGQEIVALFNKLSNLNVIVSDELADVNEVYNDHNINLKYSRLSDTDIDEITNKKSVILIPRSKKEIDDILTGIDPALIQRSIVTGQSAKFGFSKWDYAIPLSTHASYNEIVDFISKIKPSMVITTFGYHKEMAENLNRKFRDSNFAKSIKEIESIDLQDLKPRYRESHSLDTWF
jgi:Cft2 family RNA processing exonuclease